MDWEHKGAVDGHTCASHRSEEEKIVTVLAELESLRQRFSEWERADSPHPDAAKHYLEGPLRQFFSMRVPGLEASPGFTADLKHELDITMAFSANASGDDVFTVYNAATVEAHIEATYASGGRNWSHLRSS